VFRLRGLVLTVTVTSARMSSSRQSKVSDFNIHHQDWRTSTSRK